MNIIEKILARAASRDQVSPDDVIFAKIDKVMIHDVSGPGVIKVFDKLKKQGINVDKLWDSSKVWVAEDHFVPSVDKISAENIVKLQNFTKNYGIEKHFKYGMGQYGICHTLSHEEALVLPVRYMWVEILTLTLLVLWVPLHVVWAIPILHMFN